MSPRAAELLLGTGGLRYPASRRVVMALCPPTGCRPLFGVEPSISATRMDSLLPDWRDHALGVNAWWRLEDWKSREPSRVGDILEQTGCQVVVALGNEVQRALGLAREGGPLDVEEDRGVTYLRLPHPSGLCRYWNLPENREAASDALRRTLTL